MSKNVGSAGERSGGPTGGEGLVNDATADRSSAVPPARRAAPDAVGQTHAAAVVGSTPELLAAALPFLEAGLLAGDLVALACPQATVELICAELGEASQALVPDLRLSLLGSRGPDAFVTCSRYLARARATGSGRLRVLADIDFGGRPAEWREGQRFESAFNRLMVGAPVSAICLYDRRRLPEQVITSAAATHPQLVRGTQRQASPGYQDPSTYVLSLPLPREPFEDEPPVFAVEDAPTLAWLRHQLGAVFASHVRDRDLQGDLHLAASEIASNAFRHGVRPVSARVWAEGGRLVCTISDKGTSYCDPLSGFVPAHGMDLANGGMGLWMARKLWDHVDVVPTDEGLTVRLSTRLR
jgi:anti-sigma regulatory factor (Ser/Thr protein kinase)